MCEDFVPNELCRDMLTVMNIFNVLKDRHPAAVMSMLSTVLDFYEIYVRDDKEIDCVDAMAVHMVDTMKRIMTIAHDNNERMEHCKKEYEFWRDNYKDMIEQLKGDLYGEE